MKDLDIRLIAHARAALTPTARDEARVLAAVTKRLSLAAPDRGGRPRARTDERAIDAAERGDGSGGEPGPPPSRPRSSQHATGRAAHEGTSGSAARYGSSGGTTGRAAQEGASGGAMGYAAHGGVPGGAMGRAAMSIRSWGGLSQLSWVTKSLLGAAVLAGTGLGIGAMHMQLRAPVPRILASGPAAISEAARAVPVAAPGGDDPASSSAALPPPPDAVASAEIARRVVSQAKASGAPKWRAQRRARSRPQLQALEEVPAPRDEGAASLRPELEALQQAERALRRGDPARAFGILRDCEQLVGTGSMREERLALSTVARCAMSMELGAQWLAQFLAAYPASTYAERVREGCTRRD